MKILTFVRNVAWPRDVHLRVLIVVFAVVLVVLSAWEGQTFLRADNFSSMALQISDLGVLSLAMTLAMILAGIDLSVVAVANLSSIIAAMVMRSCSSAGLADGLTTVVGILVALVVGTVAGTINGFLIGTLRVPPILATLATMTLWGGVATVLTNGVSISGGTNALQAIGTQAIAGIPITVLILIGCIVGVWIFLNHTPLGVKTYLLGANSRAALFSGVNNGRVTLAVYGTSGMLASIAGIINLARTSSANPSYGASYILLTILIAVLGGVSVSGGAGRVAGVILALASLQMLSTGFNMILVNNGDSNFFKNFAWGLLLLLVVSTSRLSFRRFARSRRGRIRPTDSGAPEPEARS
ncbi:MAG: putative transporter permease protein [Microbacteriaceae bacterium]|nr:putative transporter permease protein [Microbacteriaceae bacterium]